MKKRRLHFSGVGGIGMSALAQALSSENCIISGSDRFFDNSKDDAWHNDLVRKFYNQLSNFSIKITPQDGSGVTEGLDALVVSTAIESSNPEVLKAKKLKIPVMHRSEVLADFINKFDTSIAVAGTCGKSSVTGMIGWILDYCGKSPSVVNGAPVINWVDKLNLGNVKLGNSNICVYEADESDKSLVLYKPDISIITNISEDHFSVEEARKLFDKFRVQTKRAVFDVSSLNAVSDVVCDETGSSFKYRNTNFRLNILGQHNIENALYAIETALYVGCRLNEIQEALACFKGISKRLEKIGYTSSGARVILDFAHNPVKISASLKSIKPTAGKMYIVWRPHGYAPLRNMLDALADSFISSCSRDDQLLLLPVYDAGGTADRSINSNALAEKLINNGLNVQVGNYNDFNQISMAGPDDVIIIMGARDHYLEIFAKKICQTNCN